MGPSLWLLPDAEPVGPWVRARTMLAHLAANRRPFLVFRSEPDALVRRELDGLGVAFFALGKSGLNPVSTWWKLRSVIRDHQAPWIHVWDLSDLPVAILAAPRESRFSCEVSEGQVPPRVFRWWKQGLDRVNLWYCQGRISWVDHQKVRELGGWAGEPTIDRPAFENGVSDLPVLLVADSARAVREGLWAFDIFKHAWPAARLTVLASPSTRETAKGFAGTLGLGSRIDFLHHWSEADARSPAFAVAVLGSGPWTGDAALRALAWGVPVLAEEGGAIRRAIARGAPLVPVASGDRAGLAAALQKIAVGKQDGAVGPFTGSPHFSARRDLPLYSDAVD